MARITMTLEVESPAQAALVRSYHAFLQELEAVGSAAAAGEVVDALEGAVLEKGREQLRATLKAAVQERLAAAEKKGRGCEPAFAASVGRTVGRRRGDS